MQIYANPNFMKYNFLHYIYYTGLCNINIVTMKIKMRITISNVWYYMIFIFFLYSVTPLTSALEININIVTLEWEKKHMQFGTNTLESVYLLFFFSSQNYPSSSFSPNLHFYSYTFHFTCHLWEVFLTNQSKLVFLACFL